MKTYEHMQPECVFAGHGSDFAITDFRQIDQTHMVILSNRWVRIIEMFTSVKICTFKHLKEPQNCIVLPPDFNLIKKPQVILSFDYGLKLIDFNTEKIMTVSHNLPKAKTLSHFPHPHNEDNSDDLMNYLQH